MTKQAIIFDTDIGTDIDDVLALIVLVKNTKVKNIAVVTTNGPTATRAKIAITLLKMLKKKSIPVFMGKSDSRTHTAPFVHGKEAEQVITKDSGLALRKIVTWCSQKDPQSITIITTGPLTTTSWLINQPEIKKRISKVVWMGGSIPERGVPAQEHNLQADLVAAKSVVKSGVPIWMIPLNISAAHPLNKREIEEFRKTKSKVGKFIWLGMKNWLHATKQFTGVDTIFRNKVFLHDPMTVLGALKTKQLTWMKTTIAITKKGTISIPGNNEVNICTSFPYSLLLKITQTLFSLISEIKISHRI